MENKRTFNAFLKSLIYWSHCAYPIRYTFPLRDTPILTAHHQPPAGLRFKDYTRILGGVTAVPSGPAPWAR